MKKMLFAVVLVLSISLVAKNIKIIKCKNGSVYKNVEILNVNPTGFDIACKQGNMDIVKHITFRDVDRKVREKLHYSSEKAEKYRKEIREMVERHRKVREELAKKKKTKQQSVQVSKKSKKHLTNDEIENSGIKVLLKVIKSEDNGVVAWADTPNATVTSGHLGKIFVYGLCVSSGATWAGTIYPSGTVVGNYPCYTPSVYMAMGLAKSER